MQLYLQATQRKWPLRIATLPGWVRHPAYVLIGLALWFGLLSSGSNRKRNEALTPKGVAGRLALTALILGFVLSALASTVAWAQPLWSLLGGLSMQSLMIGLTTIILGLAYRSGYRYSQLADYCFPEKA